MPTFTVVKNIFFSDKKTQDLLVNAVTGSQGFDDAFHRLFFEIKESHLQQILAPFLRVFTIKYMRDSDSQYARDFRKTYSEILDEGAFTISLHDYLKDQARNGVWGTELEAGALVDLLDMTVMVTPVNDEIPQTSLKPRESTNRAAPIIHLYNGNNIHWYLYEDGYGETLGNGNCLYNAFAQALREIILHETARDISSIEDTRAYKTQDELLAKIQHLPLTPVEQLIKKAMSTMQQSEREDHAFSLDVAKKESELSRKKQAPPTELNYRAVQHIISALSLDSIVIAEEKERKILVNFDKKLLEFKDQIKQLQLRKTRKQSEHTDEISLNNLTDTIRITEEIHAQLMSCRNAYKINPHNLQDFASKCKLLINKDHKKIIGTHREKWGFKHILDELLRCLDMLSYFTGNRFFKIQTTTEKKVKAIEKTLDEMLVFGG